MKLFILLANHFRTLSKAASTRLLSANNGTFKSFNQIVGQGRKQLDAVFQVAQAKIGTSNQAPAEPRRAGLPEALQNCLPSHVSKPRMQFQKTGFCDFPHCALGIQTFRKALVGGILCLSPLLASLAWAQVGIIANVPAYPFQVLAGSTRQINVNITGGTSNLVNWSVLSTTGGASATFTTPNGMDVSSVGGALPTVQVNIGPTQGNCTISGSGTYKVNSTATVTVQAQSVDDLTKTTSFLFNVCANSPPVLANGTSSVIVVPAYQQAYQSQRMTLQSWVVGCADESGTWSIVGEPSGGNGTLVDTTNRDAVFTASVTGRYTVKYTANCNSGTNTAIVYVSPNPMPSYASTPNGTRPHECFVDPALTGADFEVGAGKQYATISGTPALTGWAPGTIMRIWNTDTTGTNPSVYYEYYNIQNSGTATQPIIVCGVADSKGNLPTMDGTNAKAQSDVDIAAGGGIITLWPGAGHYGYWQDGAIGPNYVSITGLHLRNGNSAVLYYQPGSTTETNWDGFTACVNYRSGSYVDVSGDELDNCSNGLFSDDNDNNAWATITQNLSFMGNHVQQSGDPGDPGSTHQEYGQTFYALFEGNRIDNPSQYVGDQVKWRGVEGIFRYNYLGDGGQRILDLVDNSDGIAYVTFEQYFATGLYGYGDTAGANVIAAYQESEQKDFVYGNEMFGTSAWAQTHYAGDQDVDGLQNRNGILYFYSNTLDNAQVIIDNGFGGAGTNTYFQPRIDARNNILWARTVTWTGNAQMEFAEDASIIFNATTNLMQSGTFTIATPLLGAIWQNGTAEGWPSTCDAACLWPLTVPLNTHLYGLTAANYLSTTTLPYDATTLVPPSGSAAIGAGTALTGNPLANMPVRWEYSVTTGALIPRVDPLTIGAVDQSSGSVGAAATPIFNPGSGTYSSAQKVTISSTTPGAAIYYTTDGSTPTVNSQQYSVPITVSNSETISAIAVASGYSNSAQGSATYVITLGQVATPIFNPGAGTYTTGQTVTISDTTAGATIYYTTNGTTPTASSAVYSGPITVAMTETLEAIAVVNDYSNSAVATAAYIINLPQAAAPIFNPGAGTYTTAQTVTISDTTAGATIYYTTNGTTPTSSSKVYGGPITVATSETVEAIAAASGFNNSAIGSAAYIINLPQAAVPTFSPGAGSYSSAQTVTISSTTSSAIIYYTTNGSTPTTSSKVYGGPITIASSETVKAIAAASGFATSGVASVAYIINLGQAASPTFSPAAGTYTSLQTVAISSTTPSAIIYYTTNGTTPTTNSTLYNGPITVPSTETLKALATASGYSNSNVATAAYTINIPQVARPTFSPGTGTYTSAQTVTISTTTPSATIYYTMNGTTPTTSSPVYTGPISVASSETLVAFATASSFSSSAVASAAYTINLPAAATPAFSVPAGAYTATQTVSISDATSGSTIYYTTNGATPTTSSPVYGGPVTVSSTETLKAIATVNGYSTSAVGSAAYIINLPVTATPTFNVPSGTYTSSQSVLIADTSPGSIVYYTTNGATPTTSSAVFSSPLTVSSTETLQAIAMASGYSPSAVAGATYTINLPLPQAAAPTFSPVSGTYTSPQSVTISSATPSATIYYTTNGSTPTTGSAVYIAPITVESAETLEAIATAGGYTASTIASAAYNINLPTPDFAVAASPTSLTVPTGQSGITSVSITPLNGFNSAVSFSCSGLPSGTTCIFSPSTVTPSGAPASTTLTLAASNAVSSTRLDFPSLFPGSALAAVLCCFGWKKRRRMLMLVLLAVGTVGLCLLSGCGGASFTSTLKAFTSTITVTATSGSMQHTTTLSVNMN